jgi:hypothetical protein
MNQSDLWVLDFTNEGVDPVGWKYNWPGPKQNTEPLTITPRGLMMFFNNHLVEIRLKEAMLQPGRPCKPYQLLPLKVVCLMDRVFRLNRSISVSIDLMLEDPDMLCVGHFTLSEALKDYKRKVFCTLLVGGVYLNGHTIPPEESFRSVQLKLIDVLGQNGDLNSLQSIRLQDTLLQALQELYNRHQYVFSSDGELKEFIGDVNLRFLREFAWTFVS